MAVKVTVSHFKFKFGLSHFLLSSTWMTSNFALVLQFIVKLDLFHCMLLVTLSVKALQNASSSVLKTCPLSICHTQHQSRDDVKLV